MQSRDKDQLLIRLEHIFFISIKVGSIPLFAVEPSADIQILCQPFARTRTSFHYLVLRDDTVVELRSFLLLSIIIEQDFMVIVTV